MRSRGLTLVEVVVVAVSIGVLAAILLPHLSSARNKANGAVLRACARAIALYQEAYYENHRTYAPTIDPSSPELRPCAPPLQVTPLSFDPSEGYAFFVVHPRGGSVTVTQGGLE